MNSKEMHDMLKSNQVCNKFIHNMTIAHHILIFMLNKCSTQTKRSQSNHGSSLLNTVYIKNKNI